MARSFNIAYLLISAILQTHEFTLSQKKYYFQIL